MTPANSPTMRPPGRSLQQRQKDCLVAFARSADSLLALPQALAPMAAEAANLVGAAGASIWVHDRRARELWLAASSDAQPIGDLRVPSEATSHPAALGLTLTQPVRLGDPPESTIVAPLRGWRRALGALVLEGISTELTPDEALELSHDVARRLSEVVENLQLCEEVVRQHRLLKDSFNSLADPLIVTDNGLRVVQTNDALVKCLGRSHKDMFETPLDALLGKDLAAWVMSGTDETREEPEAGAPARPALARTRSFQNSPLGATIVVTVTPLVNDDDHLLGRVIVARDVTRQLQLEAERDALDARLAQTEKLAALGQFVAGVAHEINNPLQGVLGYVELLLRSERSAPVRTELRRVLHEADRAAKIVRNLLVFSGSRRMVHRRITVERLISRIIASRRTALAQSGVEIVRHHPELPLPIVGDPLLLQQALLNILLNAEYAIAASGKPGTIEITTEAGADGRAVVTRIRDTGTGIDGAVLARIFDPFFTTKEVNQGTGLGLTIAYGIVKEHGGSIQAANVSGGAMFTIELPLAAEPPGGPAARRRRRPGNA